MIKIIIIAVVATLAGLIAFAAVDKATGAIIDTPNSITNEEDSFSVSITGEVKRTGTYNVPVGSKLLALIEAASGVTSNADSKAYNIDFVLSAGQSFYIAPLYDNSNTCSVSPIEKVNINKADKSTLLKVSAFSSTVASSIIEYREKTASFGRIEELKNVTGIGNAIFAKAKDFVTLVD